MINPTSTMNKLGRIREVIHVEVISILWELT